MLSGAAALEYGWHITLSLLKLRPTKYWSYATTHAAPPFSQRFFLFGEILHLNQT